MKRRMNKVLCVLLALILAVSLLPVTALAEEEITEYNVWVGETRVTSANASDVLNDNGSVKYTPGEGVGTLTFTGTVSGVSGAHENAKLYASGINLTLAVNDSVNLTGSQYGIYITGGKLTFSGPGAMSVSGTKAGVYGHSGVSFTGGSFTAISTGSGDNTYGIDYGAGTVSLNNDCKVKAKGYYGGVYSSDYEGGIRVYSGTLNASADRGPALFAGNNGGIRKASSIEILMPTGGYFNGNSTTVLNANGSNATHVVLGVKDYSYTVAAPVDKTVEATSEKQSIGSLSFTVNSGVAEICYGANHTDFICGDFSIPFTLTGESSFNTSTFSKNPASGSYTDDGAGYPIIFINGESESTAAARATTMYVTIPTSVLATAVPGSYTATVNYKFFSTMSADTDIMEEIGKTQTLTLEITGIVPTVTEYPVWIGETQVTSENLSGTGWTYTPSDGAGTLTFTTATPTITGTHSDALIYASGIDLTIVAPSAGLTLNSDTAHRAVDIVNGDLTINGSVTASVKHYVLNVIGDITITGDAELTSTGVYAGYPIYTSGDVNIGGKAMIKSTAGSYYGIYASKSITIGGDTTVTGADYGIYADSDAISITGNVTCTAKNYCLYANKNVTVTGNAELTMTSVYNGYPIYANGDVNIGGKATIKSTAGSYNGIYASKSITIGGDTTVSGADYGLQASNGAISITGNVTSTSKNYCLYSTGDVTVTGDVDLTMTSVFNGYPIYANGDVNIGGKATIKVTTGAHNAIYASKSITIGGDATVSGANFGLYASNGSVTMVSGKWDIDAVNTAIRAKTGITYPTETHAVTLPEGGGVNQLTEGEGESAVTYYTVTDSDGAVAKHAIIESTVPLSPWKQLQADMAAGGEITLTQGVTADSDDTALVVPEGMEVILDLAGFTIDRNMNAAAENGMVILVEEGAKLTINDSSATRAAGTGTITGGDNIRQGGGIHVQKGTLIINGGTITGNTASKNTSGGSGDGGGIYVYKGTVVMNGGEISGNNSDFGAGIYVSCSEFTLKDGKICNNAASDNAAGVGIYAGGGNRSYFTMEGGEISGNTAVKGCSAVYVRDANNTVNLKGGTITGNKSNGSGDTAYAVVFYASSTTVNMSGSPIIEGNTNGNGKAADVNLYLIVNSSDSQEPYPARPKINVVGDITGARVGIFIRDKGDNRDVPFTNGLNGKGDASNFFSDDPDCYVTLTTEDPVGEAILGDAYPVWVGETQVNDGNKTDVLGDGKVSYDPTSQTLTFTTATPTISGLHENALIYADGIDLTIVTPSDGLTLSSDEASTGILAKSLSVNGDLNISVKNNTWIAVNASGNLTVVGDLETVGTVVVSGDVTVTGNATVDSGYQYGITAKSVDIGKDADITGGNTVVYASTGDITVGGNLKAKSTYNNTWIAVNASGNLTVAGDLETVGVVAVSGDVTVTGNATVDSGYQYGITAKSVDIGKDADITGKSTVVYASTGDITVGGNLKAKSTNNNTWIAVNASGNLTVTGDLETVGLVAVSGDVTVNGNVTVDSGFQYGISAGKKVNVISGRWDVTGSKYAIAAQEGISYPTETHAITLPEGGIISPVTIGEGEDAFAAYTVTEDDGTTVAKHAIITPIIFIEEIDFTITEPVVGATPATTLTVTAVPAEALTGDTLGLKWLEGDTNDFSSAGEMTNSTFQTGKYYFAVPDGPIVNSLFAKGYSADSATVIIKVNGETVPITQPYYAVFGPLTDGGSEPYVPNPMAITVEDPENGTATASRDEGFEGSVITITVTPDEGYEIDTVTVTDKNGNEISVHDNGDGTYTFVMPDSPVTVNVTFKESEGGTEPEHDCPSKDFRDFDPNAWYHEAVDYAVANGLMKGTSPTTFEPGTATTRAMIVTILWRLEGEPVVNSVNPFDDVEDGAWYTDAIVWAAANGIVEGYGNGKFGPNDDITREQLATMLWRYAKYKGYDVSVGEDTNIISYDDFNQISKWAVPAMQWAVGDGLIEGRTPSTIVPQGLANRAETATIFMRFIEKNK